MRGECDPKYLYSLFVSHYSLTDVNQWRRTDKIDVRLRYIW